MPVPAARPTARAVTRRRRPVYAGGTAVAGKAGCSTPSPQPWHTAYRRARRWTPRGIGPRTYCKSLNRPAAQRCALPPPLPLADAAIPLGHRLIGGAAERPVALPLHLLSRHTAVLAGAGSGKTVLLRRIIEEAALLGVPAIVLDPNNDLARLGDPWPAPPASWTGTDRAKAEIYHRRRKRSSGRRAWAAATR